MRQTQRAAAGIQTLSGSVSSLRVWLGPVTTPDRVPSVGESVNLFREPDAGNLPVRFDERDQEQSYAKPDCGGLCESTPTATGRLKPLRLFSTLLPITLIFSWVLGTPIKKIQTSERRRLWNPILAQKAR